MDTGTVGLRGWGCVLAIPLAAAETRFGRVPTSALQPMRRAVARARKPKKAVHKG